MTPTLATTTIFKPSVSQGDGDTLEQLWLEKSLKRPCQNLSVEPSILFGPSPLGLNLDKSQSFLDSISARLNSISGGSTQLPQDKSYTPQKSHSPCNLAETADTRTDKIQKVESPQQPQEKLKACSFTCNHIMIGKWERTSHFEGEVVAKCYYSKRKLVWEVLKGGLKSKIEIQWANIARLRFSFDSGMPDTIELELSHTPLFYEEMEPQPKKHTVWQASGDFTGGQASICKKHFLVFPEGAFKKPFENLLLCDPRLKALVEEDKSRQRTLSSQSVTSQQDSHEIQYSSTSFSPSLSSSPVMDQDLYMGCSMAPRNTSHEKRCPPVNCHCENSFSKSWTPPSYCSYYERNIPKEPPACPVPSSCTHRTMNARSRRCERRSVPYNYGCAGRYPTRKLATYREQFHPYHVEPFKDSFPLRSSDSANESFSYGFEEDHHDIYSAFNNYEEDQQKKSPEFSSYRTSVFAGVQSSSHVSTGFGSTSVGHSNSTENLLCPNLACVTLEDLSSKPHFSSNSSLQPEWPYIEDVSLDNIF